MHGGVAEDVADVQLRRALRQELEAAGCFRRPRAYYAGAVALITLLFFSAYGLLLTGPTWAVHAGLLLFVSVLRAQASHLGHEVSHYAVSANPRRNLWLGRFVMTFIGTGTYRRFKRLHDRHHVDPTEDGLIWRERASEQDSLPRAARDFLTHLLGRESLGDLRRGLDGETAVLLARYTLWFVVPLPFLGLTMTIVNGVVTMALTALQLWLALAIGHIGLTPPQQRGGRATLRETLRETRDLGPSALETFLWGGVNHHVTHHLFPSIATVRLARARRITRAFCATHDLPYQETTSVDALVEAVRYLRQRNAPATPAPRPSGG